MPDKRKQEREVIPAETDVGLTRTFPPPFNQGDCVFTGLEYGCPLWNRQLHKNRRSSKRPNPAHVGGARVAGQNRSHFVTAPTRTPDSRRRKLKSPRPRPSRGAGASTRRMHRSAMAATRFCRELKRGPVLNPNPLPRTEQDEDWMSRFLLAEEVLRVGHVEHGQVESAVGIALARGFEPARKAFHRAGRIKFHHPHPHLDLENDDQHAMFIHVHDEHAVFFTLLVNAVEIRFVDETGNGLVCHESTGRKRADGGQIKLLGITLMRNEKTALVNNQRGRRFGVSDEFAERFVQEVNITLNKLRQSGHVMRIAERFG